MTIIDDVSTNDMNFKHLDTAKDIVITPRNEFGGNVLLNTAHTWTAKVSDGNNYVGDYPVTLESNSIVVNSADFTNLPAGYYHLEIWEEWIDSNNTKQRSIYPSPQRTIDFTIYQNVTDLAEKEIKTIGFQDVVDQAVMNVGMNYVFKVNTIEPDQTATVVQAAADGKNYVTFNIPRGYKGDKGDPGVPGDPGERGLPGNDGLTPQIDAKTGHWMLGNLDTGVTAKGDKGDTGSVDNTGLTNAPAFQALQTQVNNSAVGTNLITNSNFSSGLGRWAIYSGTNANCKATVTTDSGGDTCVHITGAGNMCGLHCIPVSFNQNQVTTGSALVKGTGTLSLVGLEGRPRSNFGAISTDSYSKVSSTMQATSSTNNFCIYFNPVNGVVDVYIKLAKLELGSQATAWCPNPTEILTQADYAKIKAAIVALGGSLS